MVTYTQSAHETKYLASLLVKNYVIWRLADFGEERSEMAQTKTLLSNKTNLVEKGTPAFIAPKYW